MKEILIKLFERDLEKLISEIDSFKDETKLWKISGDINNSAGILCLHLYGNLQHFIGAMLGNSGYVRNREAEFSTKNVAKTKLIGEIDQTTNIVNNTLSDLKEYKLNEIYPINVFGYEMKIGFFLVHLVTHLDYHLGQINYHRRLLDN